MLFLTDVSQIYFPLAEAPPTDYSLTDVAPADARPADFPLIDAPPIDVHSTEVLLTHSTRWLPHGNSADPLRHTSPPNASATDAPSKVVLPYAP